MSPSLSTRTREAGHGSPEATRNMVMKARAKTPKSSEATEEKSDTPRIASAPTPGQRRAASPNRAPKRNGESFATAARSGGAPAARTDAKEDDEDDEGVHHGDDGGGDGGDHGLEGLDAAEEADDAEGAHELDEPVGKAAQALPGEGDEDDDHVEPVPAVAEEALGEVGEDVEEQLRGEGEGEEAVDGGVQAPQGRERAVLFGQRGGILGVEDACNEILQR